jgi:hypothetical protein
VTNDDANETIMGNLISLPVNVGSRGISHALNPYFAATVQFAALQYASIRLAPPPATLAPHVTVLLSVTVAKVPSAAELQVGRFVKVVETLAVHNRPLVSTVRVPANPGTN